MFGRGEATWAGIKERGNERMKNPSKMDDRAGRRAALVGASGAL